MKNLQITNALLCAAVTLLTQATRAGDVTGDRGNIGTNHTLSGSWSTITGGSRNIATNDFATISGGESNLAKTFGFVGGGKLNFAPGYSAIGGGLRNTNGNDGGFIGGGWLNYADVFGVIGGGISNRASGLYAIAVGGQQNSAAGFGDVIVGGQGNSSAGGNSFTGGGYKNISDLGASTVIGGGSENQVYGDYGAIGGGIGNTNTGIASTISGGAYNTASGDFSTAMGATARATQRGQVAFASGGSGSDAFGQGSVYVMGRELLDQPTGRLYLDWGTTKLVVPTDYTWTFSILITGRGDGYKSAAYKVEGYIANDNGTMSSSSSVTQIHDDFSTAVTISHNQGTHSLDIDVSESDFAVENHVWVAIVRTSELYSTY